MSTQKYDQELLDDVVKKCERIQNEMRWASAEAIEPHIDALSNLLREAFQIKPQEIGDDSLTTIAVTLEKKRIFTAKLSELIEFLVAELEDSYGEDDDFESEYISDVCEGIATTCKKYVK